MTFGVLAPTEGNVWHSEQFEGIGSSLNRPSSILKCPPS
jgi:hypothetical protein